MNSAINTTCILCTALLIYLQPASCFSGTILQTSFQDSIPKYIQQQNSVSGICFDIITELNKRLQTKKILISYPRTPADAFMPWKRIQLYLESGKLDIVVGMAKNEKRLQLYTFSQEALYTVHSVLAISADTPFRYRSLADLTGKHITAVRGTKTSKMLADVPQIQLSLVKTPTAALQMLLSGRSNLAFYHDLGLAYIIKKNNWQDKIILEKGVDEYEHFIAYNKKTPVAVREQIDSELAAIKRDGTMKRILDSYR